MAFCSYLSLVLVIVTLCIITDALAPLSSRRAILSQVVGATSAAASCVILTPTPTRAWASLSSPKTNSITTVILGSSKDKIGVELVDVFVGNRQYPVVKNVSPNGEASSNGVLPGMVLLGNIGSSKAVVERIKSGPYPIVLQFYNLAKDSDDETTNMTPEQALARAIDSGRNNNAKGPPVSSKGTALVVKTLQKGDCTTKGAQRGDTLVVTYQARVASPGGPVFDEGTNARFTMGTKQVVDGLDIGLGGMCPGEVRTLDIPSALGFGQKGSAEFDVPGDVRLWWKVELVELIKKGS